MNVKGSAVLVTGGASGLGEATCRHFAEKGALVTVLDINYQRAQEIANSIGGLAIACDVTSSESVSSAIDQSESKHGGARVLVNCAGIGSARRVVGRDGPMPLEEFTKVVNLNLIGTFNVIRLVAASMLNNKADDRGERGVIINTSSVAAFEGQIGQAAYAAAKGGVNALTIQLAREFAQFGVRVMSVAPGLFDTPLMETAPIEVRDSLSASVTFPKRLGSPEEFADLVAHIVTNQYLNGEVIRLDGAIRLTAR
ncbi:3-hydroxyacyl-CoA dehydrogenase (plasmid) [Pseudomonas koreensis]|nr:3-hydroxyacyl-CoA dehydrogenase [Pseudomonas koreensis]AVX92674.1 3-hydroxyacyl-CoA dehydrogenase [Pseudomonas koreensis]